MWLAAHVRLATGRPLDPRPILRRCRQLICRHDRRRAASAALPMRRTTGPENINGVAYSARRSKMRDLLDSAGPFVRLVAVIVFLCAAHDVEAVDPCTDTSGHKVSFVTIAPDVRVEVLDWGGGGPPLVLLAGLGNTAHVFDHFA